MKLTKLSLAAIVAVGAFGSFASASPLEEAIKGVDVSGFMRLRYYNESDTYGTMGNNPDRNRTGENEGIRVSGLFTVKAPVTDNLKFVTALATNGYNYPDVEPSGPTSPVFNKFFFQYSNAETGLTVNAGKFEIPTPWTEAGFGGSRGNGALALFSPKALPGWTFAGAAYLQTDAMDVGAGKGNLYALAAIGKVGPVGLQVWMANLEKLVDFTVFAEASFAMAGFNVRGQINYLTLNDDLFPGADGSLFAGLEGGYAGKVNNVGFNAKAGFTYTNDPEQDSGYVDGSFYALDSDADGIIKFGKQLYYKTFDTPSTTVAFLQGGVSVEKFYADLGFGYAGFGDYADRHNVGDDVGYEVFLNLGYKWAKNMNLELYYSALMGDYFKNQNQDNGEIRFEARYNF